MWIGTGIWKQNWLISDDLELIGNKLTLIPEDWNWLGTKLTLISDDLELIGNEIDNNWQTGMKK